MTEYNVRDCVFCNKTFRPTASRQKTCSAECRFREIARPFAGVDGCWEWPLSRNKQTGYGQFMVSSKPMKLVTAHRYSHEVFIGQIPDGLLACHACDNRWCFNPGHLFAGTPADNTQDMIAKGRQPVYKRLRGDQHPLRKNPDRAFRKLSGETVLAIREAVGSERSIALRFGTSRGNVRSILSGKTWAHFGSSAGSRRKDEALSQIAKG